MKAHQHRHHSSLAYLSPINYERKMLAKPLLQIGNVDLMLEGCRTRFKKSLRGFPAQPFHGKVVTESSILNSDRGIKKVVLFAQ